MESPLPLCASCIQTPASIFCLCDPVGLLLCLSCAPQHTADSLHRTHPVHAYPYRSIPGYFDRLQTRIEEFPDACCKLRKNVRRIDKCVIKLSETAENVISSIREYVATETGKLLALRKSLESDIEIAIKEVEATIFDDEPTLQHQFSPTLRSRGADISKLNLFSYEITARQQCVQLEYTGPEVPGRVLPVLHHSVLKRFNLDTGEYSASHLPLSFSEYTVFCPTDNENLLAVGGYPSSSAAYLLSLIAGVVMPQQSMQTMRALPGVIKWKSTVYVFGGLDANTRTMTASEKFDIGDRVWKAVKSMKHPRCAFCPCEAGGEIYLADAKAHKIIEVFNASTEEYRTLQTPQLSPLGNDSVSFIIDDELILLTRNMQIGRWRLNSDSEVRVSRIRMGNNSSGSTNIPPVVVGRDVYWVRWTDGVMVKFRVDSEEVVDE